MNVISVMLNTNEILTFDNLTNVDGEYRLSDDIVIIENMHNYVMHSDNVIIECKIDDSIVTLTMVKSEIRKYGYSFKKYIEGTSKPRLASDTIINSSKYINREFSWLDFNYRVLDLANRGDIPILERANFLSITDSNLDEFIMVRLGSVYEKIKRNSTSPDISGLSPYDEFTILKEKIEEFKIKQRESANTILKELFKNDIEIVEYVKLIKKDKRYIDKYFKNRIFPVLTPMVIDTGRPFPNVKSRDLQLCGIVNDDVTDDTLFNITIPSKLDRLIPLDSDTNKFVLLEDIIVNSLHYLFVGKHISDYGFYRVLRNTYTDIITSNNRNNLLIDKMKYGLKMRDNEEVLVLEHTLSKDLKKVIRRSLNIKKGDMIQMNSVLDLTLYSEFTKLNYPELKFKKYQPQYHEDLINETNIFDAIDNGDVLLHHPYESFDPVVQLIQTASTDPNVITIKQTLYRVSNDSPIVKALETAAENGKHVIVLVEVKARFSESDNIEWATRLEHAGCHVVYGLENLKVHSKVALIVRQTDKGNLKQYVHLGTGNYNDKTARIYTDFSLLTKDSKIADDVMTLFNILTGFSKPLKLSKLIYSPVNLKENIMYRIDNEINNVKKGFVGHITFKFNSLTDKDMIDKLYEASENGVKVELIVRGLCCIKPINNNITITSIVGRYLEHSRIYRFYNNGKNNIFLSSADLMTRNLNNRIEVGFPIHGNELKKKINNCLMVMSRDNFNSYVMQSDTKYTRTNTTNDKNVNCHDVFMKEAIANSKVKTYVKFK